MPYRSARSLVFPPGIAVIPFLLASPLPAQILDDAGRSISEAEIERVTDPGISGGVIGGLAGLFGGVAISFAFIGAEDNNSRFLLAPVALAVIGDYAGARLARVDREEAVERIRSRRRSESGTDSSGPASSTP
jgi:hypothetical protein